METLLRECEVYLQTTLGISLEAVPWRDAGRLPNYLLEAYAVFKASICGMDCLLLVGECTVSTSPATIKKHVTQVEKHWDGGVVYVCQAMPSYIRARLIQQRTAFIVPGNQMYLPPLGMDLREHFRAIRTAPTKFSPATQAVVIHALLSGAGQTFTPAYLSQHLHYSLMTMTRVFDELRLADVADVRRDGKARTIRFDADSNALWESMEEFLSSPVRRRVWISLQDVRDIGLTAGLSALASYTALAAPDLPVYAIGSEVWKALLRDGVKEYPFPDAAADLCELEIWRYPPRALTAGARIDPFSLYCSLRHIHDERIEAELADMLRRELG